MSCGGLAPGREAHAWRTVSQGLSRPPALATDTAAKTLDAVKTATEAVACARAVAIRRRRPISPCEPATVTEIARLAADSTRCTSDHRQHVSSAALQTKAPGGDCERPVMSPDSEVRPAAEERAGGHPITACSTAVSNQLHAISCNHTTQRRGRQCACIADVSQHRARGSRALAACRCAPDCSYSQRQPRPRRRRHECKAKRARCAQAICTAARRAGASSAPPNARVTALLSRSAADGAPARASRMCRNFRMSPDVGACSLPGRARANAGARCGQSGFKAASADTHACGRAAQARRSQRLSASGLASSSPSARHTRVHAAADASAGDPLERCALPAAPRPSRALLHATPHCALP